MLSSLILAVGLIGVGAPAGISDAQLAHRVAAAFTNGQLQTSLSGGTGAPYGY